MDDPRRPETERVTSGGVELAVRRLGHRPDDGRLLVALHGGPGLDHHILLPLGERLARHHTVWLPDLPGHGASLTPSGRPPGLRALEDRLALWLRGLAGREGGVEVLVGHSLGAWLVSELLRHRRVTPRAAVLLSPPAAGQARAESALARVAVVAGGFGAGDSAGARRDFLGHVAAEARGEPSAELAAAAGRVAVRPPRDYRALLRNLHRAFTGPVRPYAPSCPVLVLAGTEDRTTPPEQAERTAAAIEGAHLELLSGAGHYLFGDRPDAVAEHIASFVAAALGLSGESE